MSEFPREVDLRKTSHFLFEVGSLMSLLFGVLFFVSVVAVLAAYTSGTSVALGLVVSVVFGLLAVNGVVFLYWSTKFDR